MEDDSSVRKLVELIFSKQFQPGEEITAADTSIGSCLLTNDISKILKSILYKKIFIFLTEWENYISTWCNIMFSSHNMYLRCVFFACLTETTYHENIFEIFISVCALIKFFNDRILLTSGIDFCDLNTNAIMVFYNNVLKSCFCEKDGFEQLVEYIRGHRYRSWKWINLDSTDSSAKYMILKDILVEKKSNRSGTHKTVKLLKSMEKKSRLLARKVLEGTSVHLPTLSNIPDLILIERQNPENTKINEILRIRKAAEGFEDMNATSQECSGLKSDLSKGLKTSKKENGKE